MRLIADDRKVGLATGVLSAATIGLVSLLIHLESRTLPASEILFARGAIGLFAISPFVWRGLARLKERNVAAVWVRAFAGAISQLAFTWNLQHTSVGLANILFNTSLFMILLGASFSGEGRLSMRTLSEMGLILAGIFIYWKSNETPLTANVLLVGISGAFAATVAYTALKKATKVANPWLITWVVCLAEIPVSLVSKSVTWEVPSTQSTISLLVIALGILISQYLLILSFSRLSLALATALTPSCIVWSVVGDTLTRPLGATFQGVAGSSLYAFGIGALAYDHQTAAPPSEVNRSKKPAGVMGDDVRGRGGV